MTVLVTSGCSDIGVIVARRCRPLELPRSMTQPFQVLWLLGVQVAAVQTPGVHVPLSTFRDVQTRVQVPLAQVPPLFWQVLFVVYCDFEQALLLVQLLWFVSARIRAGARSRAVFWRSRYRADAVVQVLWVLLLRDRAGARAGAAALAVVARDRASARAGAAVLAGVARNRTRRLRDASCSGSSIPTLQVPLLASQELLSDTVGSCVVPQ